MAIPFWIVSCVLGAGLAGAETFHVRTDGSDASCDGLVDAGMGASPNCAFRSVQRGLDMLDDGDTLYIHAGTYVGDFDCCGHGSSVIGPPVGTANQPTRILGWPGDTVVLEGTSGQGIPEPDNGGTDLGTLTLNCSGSANCTSGATPASYVEVGNLTIRSGNAAALTAVRGRDLYLHDLTFDDQSLYEGGTAESRGLVYLARGERLFVENMTFNSANDPVPGTRRTYSLFQCGRCKDSKFRMIDATDIEEGNTEAAHHRFNTTWEYIKLRNWTPWNDDDGALNDGYNSSVSTFRYMSAQEAPSSVHPVFGFLTVRRTRCGNAAGPNSAYVVSSYGEDDAPGPDRYGFIRLHEFDPVEQDGDPGCEINDVRVYNSVMENFTRGILAALGPNPNLGGPQVCDMFDWDHNAYVNAGIPVQYGVSGCDGVEMGPNSFVAPSVDETDHVPSAGSAIVDVGYAASFEGTPWLPVPEGGGSASDIGAYELGAGPWPYDFQFIGSARKDPSAQTIRICWDSGVAACDVTIPLWDPWVQSQDARCSTPDWFQVQLDASSSFHSGNAGVSPGFGAFHDSGAVNSTNRFYDVPVGSLAENQGYYVQVRVGETNDVWQGGSDCLGSNGGWGPWSVGFYRFLVDTGSALQPPKNLRIVP